MTRSIRALFGSVCLGGAGLVAAAGLMTTPAQAFVLPGSSGQSAAVCTCGNLEFANSNVVGNIGIADSGEFIGSGSGTITGMVEFSAANTGQYMPDGITVTGGAAFGITSVQTGINTLNALSQGLSGEAGTSLDINAGGAVNASSGMLDGNGNEVFTATIDPNFVQGTTFTINGNSGQFVVINIPATGSLSFDGSIILTGGITSDQVLFNFDSGDYESQTGGASLTIENSVVSDPATTGTYFDPNGPIDIVDAIIDGRVFGGPTDFSVTDSDIVAPVPEPSSLALFGAGLAAFGIICWWRRARPART